MRGRSARAALGALLALAVAGAWPASLFRQFHRSLETRPGEVGHVGAIVSLAGGAGRLDRGLDLFLAGKADVLLLSGTGKGATLGEIFKGRELGAYGDRVILLESRSTSTYENAIEAWAALAARGPVEEIVLLTSNYHMLRAEYVFRKVFPPEVRIHPYPVAAEGVVPGRWWRESKTRRIVVNEYAKYLWYRVRY